MLNPTLIGSAAKPGKAIASMAIPANVALRIGRQSASNLVMCFLSDRERLVGWPPCIMKIYSVDLIGQCL